MEDTGLATAYALKAYFDGAYNSAALPDQHGHWEIFGSTWYSETFVPGKQTTNENFRRMTMEINAKGARVGAMVRVPGGWMFPGGQDVPDDDRLALLESFGPHRDGKLRHVRSRKLSNWPPSRLIELVAGAAVPTNLASFALTAAQVQAMLAMPVVAACSDVLCMVPLTCLACGSSERKGHAYACEGCSMSSPGLNERLRCAWIAHVRWINTILVASDQPERIPAPAQPPSAPDPAVTEQRLLIERERDFRQREIQRLIARDGGIVCADCGMREATHKKRPLCDECWRPTFTRFRAEILDQDGAPQLPGIPAPWAPSVSDADCLGSDV